jgi:PAS domain S-box-containing protein
MYAIFRFRDWPLRAKMAALLVAASLIPLMIATVVDVRQAREQALENGAALLAARADGIRSEFDVFHRGYQISAQKLAHLPRFVEFSAANRATAGPLTPAIRGILEANRVSDPNLRGLAIVDKTGTVLVATEERMVGRNLAYQSSIRESLGGKAVISDLYLAPAEADRVPTIAYTAPLFGADKELRGLVVLWVRAQALWDIAKASLAFTGPESYAVVVDQLGIRIAHTRREKSIFRPVAALAAATIDTLVAEQRFGEKTRELLEDVRPNKALFERALDAAPDSRMYRAYAPGVAHDIYAIPRRLKSVPWTIFFMVPAESIDAPIAAMTRAKLIYAGAIICFALVAGALVSTIILRPVRSLATATDAIAGGDLAARVQPYGNDELGQLGASFNAMATRVQAQAATLQTAHDELELRVRARTRELETTTAALQAEIREREAAEKAVHENRQALDAIVESSDDAIISKSLDGIISSWNPGAAKIFGYAAHEAIGNPLQMLIPADRTGEEPDILARIARGESVAHFETVRRKKDGTLIDVSATISPIRDVGGRIVGASKIARDITGQRQLERQLRQSQKMEALGQLTGGVAHDFNNMLGVIIGNLDLLEALVATNETAARRVQTAQKAALRGADVTRRLLSFASRHPLNVVQTALGESIHNVTEMAALAIGPAISITTFVDPALGPAWVDAGELENVLLNLVVNARDAMPHGGSIAISAKPAELDAGYPPVQTGELKAGHYLCVAVSDTGHGMSRDTLERMFEPFFTTKPRGQGTGLGLAMAYGFAKQAGGYARIYSEEGHGTTVSLYLPRAEVSEIPARLGSRPAAPARVCGTVLVVDDEFDLLEIAVTYLEELGLRVLHATDGPSALGIVEREPGIDLLVTDVIMPGGMNGVELAGKAKQLIPGIKIIYTSGFPSTALAKRSDTRIDGPLLYKPYQRNNFIAAIKSAMENAGNESNALAACAT